MPSILGEMGKKLYESVQQRGALLILLVRMIMKMKLILSLIMILCPTGEGRTEREGEIFFRCDEGGRRGDGGGKPFTENS